MSRQPKILALAGSTRRASFNKQLVRIAAAAARRAGAQAEILDLRDYPLPLFDQDLEPERGLPDEARELKRILGAHDGLLIASPEYNSSVSGVLKNAIDWASRQAEPSEAPLASFDGKTAVLMSASPGSLGGLRGLVHLRSILGNLRVLVLPDQRAVPRAHKAFAEDGSLQDPRLQTAIESLGERLVAVLTKLLA
jgi:NAD(P)H-dependent FMN reductase